MLIWKDEIKQGLLLAIWLGVSGTRESVEESGENDLQAGDSLLPIDNIICTVDIIERYHSKQFIVGANVPNEIVNTS